MYFQRVKKFLLIKKNQICILSEILGYRVGEERFVDDFRGEIDFFLNFKQYRVSTLLTIHSTRMSFFESTSAPFLLEGELHNQETFT